MDLLGSLPSDITPEVACPEGPLAALARNAGVMVHPIAGTAGSLRLHPRHTPRAMVELAVTAGQVRRLTANGRFEIVHANSIRAGMVAGAARGRTRIIAHARDRLPPNTVSRAALAVMGAGANAVIANSSWTAEGLGPRLARRAWVVPSPVDLRRFDPDLHDRVRARADLGVTTAGAVLTVVGQITPWKGQDDAIRTAALLSGEGHDVHLLVVGGTEFVSEATRYDNRAYLASLERLVDELDIRDRVTFTGARSDIPFILSATDVLLVPSWAEPFGRTVIEGMAMGLPVVATSIGGPAEIIASGDCGVLAAPQRPEVWAAEVGRLLADPSLRSSIAARARRRARDYGVQAHVEATLRVYDAVRRPTARTPRIGRPYS